MGTEVFDAKGDLDLPVIHLDEVDLHLAAGWSGPVGKNGAGKTTLLRLFAGELAPESGCIRIEPAGARVVLCPQLVEAAGPDVEDLAERGDGGARRLKALLQLEPKACRAGGPCSSEGHHAQRRLRGLSRRPVVPRSSSGRG